MIAVKDMVQGLAGKCALLISSAGTVFVPNSFSATSVFTNPVRLHISNTVL